MPPGAVSTLTPKACPTWEPFSTPLLHNLPAPAGHNLRRSRAPFPFIFSAQRALPQPSRRRHVPPGNFSTTLLHNPPAPAGHNLRRSRAPFPFPLYIQRPKGATSTLTPKACPTCAPFPQPFYTTCLRQQATTCGEAAPLSPLYSAPEGRLLPL